MERRRALEKWHGASTWNCLRPIVQKSNVSSVKDMLGHQNHTKYLLFQRLPKCANAIFGAFGSVVAACVWPIVDDFYFTSRVVYADNPDVLHLTFRCSVFFFFLSASKPTRIVSLFGTYCVSFVNTFNVDIRRQTDVCPLPVTMWATKTKKTLSASTWASALSTEYYCLCWFDVAHILNRNTGTPSTERNAGVPMLLFLNNSHRMPETNLGHRQNIWIIYWIVTLDSRGTRPGRHERQKRRKWWIGE